MKLPLSFYRRDNTLVIAKELLGKVLVTSIRNIITSGIITETEAYVGITDKACHAFGGRHTERTKIMYENGGVAYVYLCYGIHHLFNVVTHEKGEPHAILIRAIEPVDGISEILKRRKSTSLTKTITTGPGKVSNALGIKTSHTGQLLTGKNIWIEDQGIEVRKKDILITPRIGVDYAGKDALLPYRFCLNKKVK
ncbi:MAG: DNA-3-methyladenine glycosylase [Flavobacteriales bacterium]